MKTSGNTKEEREGNRNKFLLLNLSFLMKTECRGKKVENIN